MLLLENWEKLQVCSFLGNRTRFYATLFLRTICIALFSNKRGCVVSYIHQSYRQYSDEEKTQCKKITKFASIIMRRVRLVWEVRRACLGGGLLIPSFSCNEVPALCLAFRIIIRCRPRGEYYYWWMVFEQVLCSRMCVQINNSLDQTHTPSRRPLSLGATDNIFVCVLLRGCIEGPECKYCT